MKGRHIEAASVEESQRFLADLSKRSARKQPNYDPPHNTTVEVASATLIRFSGDAVPPNFQNLHLPHVRPRWQGPSRWSVASDWREWAATWGRQARAGSGWQTGIRASVEVAFHRVRSMDKDGRFGAAKHIVDGVVDAGLLVADDPAHLPDGCYEALQVEVGQFADQRTVVTVRWLP